jgi:hypothetical protein
MARKDYVDGLEGRTSLFKSGDAVKDWEAGDRVRMANKDLANKIKEISNDDSNSGSEDSYSGSDSSSIEPARPLWYLFNPLTMIVSAAIAIIPWLIIAIFVGAILSAMNPQLHTYYVNLFQSWKFLGIVALATHILIAVGISFLNDD